MKKMTWEDGMKEKYYIAYGINMHLSQMTYRCPRAVLLGKSQLENYALRFRGHPFNAFATVEPVKNESVPILIWMIQVIHQHKQRGQTFESGGAQTVAVCLH